MRKLLVAAASLIVLLSAAVAGASNPPPFNWNRVSTLMLQSLDTPGNIGAYNTTGCVWNDEDYQLDTAGGKLAAGQSSTDTLCLVTDMCHDGACPHTVQVQVANSSQVLNVQLSDTNGNVWIASPVKGSTLQPAVKGYVWQLCVADPLWNVYTNWPVIPDTNGGVGIITHYTLTVTASKTTNPSGYFEIGMHNWGPGSFNPFQLPSPPC